MKTTLEGFKLGDRVEVREGYLTSCRGSVLALDHKLGMVIVAFGTDKHQYKPKQLQNLTQEAFDEAWNNNKKPDGGPAAYYDFPKGMITLNDWLEYMGDFWLADTFHLANIVKAATRWGRKEGTDKSYDSRKFIYSGARLLKKYAGTQEVRKTLQRILDDPQFQEDNND